MVLLAGEAGVGKSSLVRALLNGLPDAGRRWTGLCEPWGTPTPLGPWLDIADQVPAVRDALHDAPVHELGARLLDLLHSPTVLVIEDIHWMDDVTAELLARIGRRIHRTRAMVVLTFRDGPETSPALTQFLGAIGTAPNVHQRRVPPLSKQAVRSVAMSAGLDADELWRRTAGNPFYVTEVLAHPGRSVPPTVAAAVLGRVRRMSAPGRTLLDLVSLSPEGLEVEVAEDVLGATEARTGLDEADHHGLLVLQRGWLRFHHELGREAVANAVPPSTERDLRLRLLAALERRGSSGPARLAQHAALVGDAERVRRHAPTAASEAYRRGAYAATSAHLQSALALGDALDPLERARLLDMLADSRVQIDTPERLVELRSEAADAWAAAGRPTKQARQLVLIAGARYRLGDLPGALEAIGRAQDLVAGAPLDPDVAYVRLAELTVDSLTSGLPEARAATEKVVPQLWEVGATEVLPTALRLRAEQRVLDGDVEAGIADGHRAYEVATTEAPQLVVQESLNLASTLLECYQAAPARSFLERALQAISEREEPISAHHLAILRGRLHLEAGRYAAARRVLEEDWTSSEPVLLLSRAAVLGLVQARIGDPAAAATLEEAATLVGTTINGRLAWPTAAARAENAWLRDEPDRIEDVTTEAFGLVVMNRHPWAAGELWHWRWRAGLDDGPAPPWLARPWRLLVSGEWEAAAQEWAALGAPYEQALALSGGDGEARRRALEILDRLGAAPLADRVRAELRREGADHLPARPRTHGGELTDRHLEVLALLTEGLTNVQIAQRLHITPKTAGHHVSAILERLGARSRAEAASLAIRRGLVPGK